MVFCRRNRKGTENALLTAAAKLFSQKGYENTRTLDIAKEAGVNEALILRYFGGKEGLLTAVLKDEISSRSIMGSDHCQIEPMPVQEGMSLRDALHAFFKMGQRRCELKEEFMRIAIGRALHDPEIAKLVREKIVEQSLPMLAEHLKPYLRGKKISREDLEAYTLLTTATSQMFNFWGRRVHRLDSATLDRSIELFIDAIAASIESK